MICGPNHFAWFAAGVVTLVGVGAYSSGFALQDLRLDGVSWSDGDPFPERLDSLDRVVAGLEARGNYLVVDRGNNRLWIRTTDAVRLEAVVSTGSGTVLREAGGQGRTWVFDTPSGEFRILAERLNPIWVKPDWAFLEEGRSPPLGVHERVETGALGEWALDLGDGYMIHGTLYERLLGRSITHGCVRVGRDDLRAVVKAAHPGTPVFIF